MPRRKRNAPPAEWPTSEYLKLEPSKMHLVRPREPFVELPGLGFPTPDQIDDLRARWQEARKQSRGMQLRRETHLGSLTWREWGEHLTGNDTEWALRAVRYLKHILRRREEMVIAEALRSNMGWDAIGAILGVSRQAVAQRWGRLADRIWQEEARERAEARARGDTDFEDRP